VTTRTDTGLGDRAFGLLAATTGISIWDVARPNELKSEGNESVVPVSGLTESRGQDPRDLDTATAVNDVSREAARELRTFRQPPVPRNVHQYVSGMQKWEGHVTSVDDDLFSAELWPLGGEGPVVMADFERSLIADGDVELLAEGAVFYCTVRTIRGPGGQPFRTSAVRMRRLGVWTEEAVGLLMARAQERAAALERFTD